MKNLLQRVEEERPKFADDILEPFPAELQKDINEFSSIHYWNACTIIDVSQVIGTEHPDYADKSWLNLLQNGRRMSINIPLLATNPNYYFETSPKIPPMYFKSVNGKLYIGGDGNHRTCIAKFFFHYKNISQLGGVSIDEYVIDYDFKNICEECIAFIQKKRLPLRYEIIRQAVKREDIPGWMKEHFSLKAVITNFSNGARFEMDANNMNDFLIESENIFRRWTGKYKMLWKG